MSPPPLLSLRDVRVTYPGGVRAVRGMSFDLAAGECLALVGESGCGKSSVTRAVLALLPANAEVTGSIRFAGRELMGLTEREMRGVRGREIGLVWQDPFDALNPLHSVERHVAEAWRAHGDVSDRTTIAARLAGLGIEDAEERMQRYPHHWSGGMLQRAAIAAAAAYRPRLIIADEPTSALDTDRAGMTLEAIRATGAAVILVSHDLALVARHADRIAVCYAGKIVEIGAAEEITSRPRHPYSVALLRSTASGRRILPTPIPGTPPAPSDRIAGCPFEPRCTERQPSCAAAEPPLLDGLACPIAAAASDGSRAAAVIARARPSTAGNDVVLAASGLRKVYGRGKEAVTALAAADFILRRGEIVGIGGPSGCGKSTLLRILAGIEQPTGGVVTVRAAPGGGAPFAMAIFQDASGSLDARWPVWRTIVEPLLARSPRLPRRERKRIAVETLAEVGLAHVDPDARPGELSVGQCQRVAIARALVAAPAFIAADEPTSALDAPVAASILALLSDIAARGTAIVVVSHDRALLAACCDRVLTMRRGVLENSALASAPAQAKVAAD